MEQGEDQQAEAGSEAQSTRTPPYISFRTLLTFIEDLKNVGVPPRIDRSVLTRFSGGVGSQLLMALKSLGLVNEAGVPTQWLAALVTTYGTAAFKSPLQRVLRYGYPYLQELDLKTATPSMFADAFKEAVDAKEDVLRKCRTFYLHAAKEAGVEIGPRLEKGTQTRAPSVNGRKRAKPAKVSDVSVVPPVQAFVPVQSHGKELEYQLIDLMTEPDIDDNVKQSIWSLVQYLTARKMKKAAAPQEATA